MECAKRHGNAWSIVLAAGEGERLKPYVRQWLGYEIPKQYCTFVGTRSLLQHTLDRADEITAPAHKVTVVAQDHRRRGWPEHLKRKAGRVVVQPMNRGTAAAVFLALTYIRHEVSKTSESRSASLPTVLLFPSDHFVYPEDRFLEIVRAAVGAAEILPQKMVLLGVTANRAEMDYGWIETGSELGHCRGHRLQAATYFKEKPLSNPGQQPVLAASGLWNTLILATNGDLLWSLGHSCFPEMMSRLECFAASIGHTNEEAELDALYQELSSNDFSSGLLEALPQKIAVLELSGILWSDWGRPERILESLAAIGKAPAFSLSRAVTA